ncbi:LptF/LptG family permease [bacterium]|nr:LptF/LptG family permease [bacterium]
MPPASVNTQTAPPSTTQSAGGGRGWMKIVDRMMLGELRGPVISGIAMFALLIIFAAVLQEALKFQIKYGLPNSLMFKWLLLAAPQFIVLAIPMGVLLGTMLAIGRLNNDHEIVALRASGLSLWRVILPPLLLGALLSVVTYWGNEWLVPRSLSALTRMKNDVISGKEGTMQRDRAIIPIYQNDEMRWALLADRIDGQELTGVKLLYFDPVNDYNDYFLEARRAQWNGSTWIFYGVRIVKLQESENSTAQDPQASGSAAETLPDQRQNDRVILEVEEAEAPDFDIRPGNLGIKAKTTDELTSRELLATIRDTLRRGDKLSSPVVRELRTKFYFKQSIPLTPLLFVLLAFPLAIRSTRTSTGVGFGIALLLVLVYYACYSTCLRMGTSGALAPALAAWLPNLILGGTGIWLIQRRQKQ